MDQTCESTSAGLVYSYNIPQEYRSTGTSSISCYKQAKNYGSCRAGQIVPPTPTTIVPQIFLNLKPHSYKPKVLYQEVPPFVNYNRNYNRNYNNATGSGPYGSDGANSNTQDTYRKISIPNSALSCGGLGSDTVGVSNFKPGFNDVAYF